MPLIILKGIGSLMRHERSQAYWWCLGYARAEQSSVGEGRSRRELKMGFLFSVCRLRCTLET